jgi:STE24 endopeptidase
VAPRDPAGLPLLVLAAGTVFLGGTPLLHALSRRHERRADAFALALTGQPASFISALRRLSTQNLAESHPSRLARWLFYSHPPFEERIEAARAYERTAAA